MFWEFRTLQKFENPKIYFYICSYIQKMTLNLIENFETTIYSPKHTTNKKIHVNFLQHFQTSIFFNKKVSNESAFYAYFYGIIYNLFGTTSYFGGDVYPLGPYWYKDPTYVGILASERLTDLTIHFSRAHPKHTSTSHISHFQCLCSVRWHRQQIVSSTPPCPIGGVWVRVSCRPQSHRGCPICP